MECQHCNRNSGHHPQNTDHTTRLNLASILLYDQFTTQTKQHRQKRSLTRYAHRRPSQKQLRKAIVDCNFSVHVSRSPSTARAASSLVWRGDGADGSIPGNYLNKGDYLLVTATQNASKTVSFLFDSTILATRGSELNVAQATILSVPRRRVMNLSTDFLLVLPI